MCCPIMKAPSTDGVLHHNVRSDTIEATKNSHPTPIKMLPVPTHKSSHRHPPRVRGAQRPDATFPDWVPEVPMDGWLQGSATSSVMQQQPVSGHPRIHKLLSCASVSLRSGVSWSETLFGEDDVTHHRLGLRRQLLSPSMFSNFFSFQSCCIFSQFSGERIDFCTRDSQQPSAAWMKYEGV